MRLLNRFIAITMLSFCLLAPLAWAQDDSVQPVAPLPAIGQQDATSANVDQQQSTEQPATSPDTRPPSGAQDLTIGFPENGRNYLKGYFDFLQTVDTNPQLGPHHALVGTITNLIGDVALDRSGKSSSFELQYMGAGFIPTHQQFGNTQAHQLGVSQAITTGRWALLLADEAIYSPEGGYGFGGLGATAGLGVGSQTFTGLNPGLINQQTAFFAARRIDNTSLAQVQYSLSARSSITTYGSYGMLHFLDGGFIDSDQVMANVGYNYSPTRHNTFSLTYGYGQFHFGGESNTGLKAHSVNLGYARRVTGRLSVQIFAGPQLITTQSLVSVPLLQLGSFIISGLEKENFRRLSWSGYSDVKYSMGRTDLTLSFMRSVTGGSGLLAGAQTTDVQASVGRAVGRSWSARINSGYAHSGSVGAGVGSYNAVYGGAGLHRRIGHASGLDLTYQLQRQRSDAVCTSAVCGGDFLRHVFGVGVRWQFRPIRLD